MCTKVWLQESITTSGYSPVGWAVRASSPKTLGREPATDLKSEMFLKLELSKKVTPDFG